MSDNRPETLTDPVPHHEIAAMNREFLALLVHPLLQPHRPVLGLDAGIIGSLRCMSAPQLDRLATAPLLLADFQLGTTSDRVKRVVVSGVADLDVSAEWQALVCGYANRLLACLWQFSQQGNGIASFCAGLDTRTATALANLGFAELSQRSAQACHSLRARHADHATCWPDLVRLAVSDNSRLSAAQLSLIPLTIAHQHGELCYGDSDLGD